MTSTTPANSALTTFISTRQAALHKTDQDLAQAMGFAKTSVITMIKAGTMKLPLPRIQQLAGALEAPAIDLLRAALTDYMPDLLQLLEELWATAGLTQNEQKLLDAYRTLTKGKDVRAVVLDGRDIIALVTV